MPTRTSSARWQGDLKDGAGTIALGSGAFEGQYSFTSRFEDGNGTNPEELIAAAHAGCFSMAFSNMLAQAGSRPTRWTPTANVHFGKTEDRLRRSPASTWSPAATCPASTRRSSSSTPRQAKAGCPISKALAAVDITLDATKV